MKTLHVYMHMDMHALVSKTFVESLVSTINDNNLAWEKRCRERERESLQVMKNKDRFIGRVE